MEIIIRSENGEMSLQSCDVKEDRIYGRFVKEFLAAFMLQEDMDISYFEEILI